MSKNKPALARGTRDFGPVVSAKRNYIIDTIKRNFIQYGFQQIETPAIENLSTLTGKYGDEGDKLLFKILNSGEFSKNLNPEDYDKSSQELLSKISEKGLRYDLTVPFARFVVMNQNEITFPFKRFQIQPVWRADRPQKGRYREFYQCDADIIGSKNIWNEIELTLLLLNIYRDLGLGDFSVKVNHREILFLMADYVGLEDQKIPFCAEIDKLDKIGTDRVTENVLALGANADQLKKVIDIFSTKDFNSIIQKLQALGETDGLLDVITFFDRIKALDAHATKVELDPSLARGLSYYTGMIFEVKPTSVAMGSINGGGRYDDLTGVFGLSNLSGVGISFGLDRIYDVMEELQLFPAELDKKIDVLIVHFNEACFHHGQEQVLQLRANGIKADIYPESVKIRKQFDYAGKIKVPYVIVIGEDEIKSGQYMLKDMEKGTQEALSLDEIKSKIRMNE